MKTRYFIFTFLFSLSASIVYGQDTLEEKFNKLDKLNMLETNMAKANIGNALQYTWLLYQKNTPGVRFESGQDVGNDTFFSSFGRLGIR